MTEIETECTKDKSWLTVGEIGVLLGMAIGTSTLYLIGVVTSKNILIYLIIITILFFIIRRLKVL